MEIVEPTNVYAYKLITKKDYFAPGHRACQGCAEALAVRLVAKALGRNVIVASKALGRNVIVASATGCMEIISSPWPFTSWRVPWIHIAFENAAAVASGVEAGMKVLIAFENAAAVASGVEAGMKVLMRKGKVPKKKITFLAMAGDGGTSDIGVQALSGALERGHDFVYICYDNEAYNQ